MHSRLTIGLMYPNRTEDAPPDNQDLPPNQFGNGSWNRPGCRLAPVSVRQPRNEAFVVGNLVIREKMLEARVKVFT